MKSAADVTASSGKVKTILSLQRDFIVKLFCATQLSLQLGGTQVEVWTLKDFPTQPPLGCELSQQQYDGFVQTKVGTTSERPRGEGVNLPASAWKQYLIDEAVLNWF